MKMQRFFSIIERDHTYQNPTSAEKLDLLIEYCGIGDGQRVLDAGCGKGWLLRRMASRFAIEADGIEINPVFVEEGRQHALRGPLKGALRVHQMPALEFPDDPHAYDVGLCIGASFAIGTFDEMLAWLRPYVRPGGIIAVGDIYARADSIPEASAQHFAGGPVRTMEDTILRMNQDGLSIIGLIDSSLDDWDRYESKHWRAGEAWARENPNDPDLAEFLVLNERFKMQHLKYDRDALGWALFVSRVA